MQKEAALNKMWNDFPHIKEDLLRCRKFILDFIDIPNEEVKNCVLELVNSDAKLIRPALMIITGKMLNDGKDLDDDFIAMAATLEMLHIATLIHDDVVDDSPLRRGVATLQSRYGKDVATYAGDYMLSSVFSNVLDYSKTMENAKIITSSVNKILSGELIQMQNRNNFCVSEGDYYKIIHGKTAVMIALCCYEGAYMTGKYDMSKKLWDMGESIGMAFQIIDDILDYSDEKTIKKPPFQDFREGNFTLPILYSMKNYIKELKKIKEDINIEEDKGLDFQEIEENKKQLKKIVEISGGIDYSRKKAREYTNIALSILDGYEKSEYREYLHQLIKKLLDRSY